MLHEAVDRVMSTPPSFSSLGLAAEYLVLSDLLLQGFKAYPSASFLPYDIALDLGGRLIRLQVKSTATKKTSKGRRGEFYEFRCTSRSGGIKASYREGDFDLMACVALDSKIIAYLPFSSRRRLRLSLPPQGEVLACRYKTLQPIDQYPLHEALRAFKCY